MRRKIFSIAVLMIICSLNLVAFGNPSNFVENLFSIEQSANSAVFQFLAQPQQTKGAQPPSKELPDNILWYIVLSMDEKLEKEAEELNREGKDGTLFSAYFRRQGKLSAENEKIFKQISADFKKEIKPVEQKAQKIIDEARKKAKNGAGAAAISLPPPPSELEGLQKQRNEITLRYRDLFKQAVGVAAFNQFSDFLAQEFSKSAVETIPGTLPLNTEYAPNEAESTQTNVGRSILFYNDDIPTISGRAETYLDFYTAYYYDPAVESALNNASYGYTLSYRTDVGVSYYDPAAVSHPTFTAIRGSYYCLENNHYKVDAYVNLLTEKSAFQSDTHDNLSTETNILAPFLNSPDTPASPSYAYYLGSSGSCHYFPVAPPCEGLSDVPCPQPTPTPTPTPTPAVAIVPLDVVEKNNTRDVNVTVTNNAAGFTTFTLRTVTGTGSATFADGSTSITVNGNVTNQTLTIKGVAESSQADNITIEAKFNNSSTVSAHDEFTVATITSLIFDKFEADYTTIDDNPGNGHLNTNGQPDTNIGQRIFPDKESPGDMKDRSLVKVNAIVSPAIPNLKVYFGSYDLDDPSADTAPLDSSSDGNDNNGAVNGSKSGDFTVLAGNTCVNPSTGAFINYISTIECPTQSDGTATAQYKITMQPGDNIAVAASLQSNYRDEIRVNNVDGTKLINSANKTIPISGEANNDNAAGIRTKMLTVWRRLHIEVDSMEDVTTNHETGNFTNANSFGVGYPTLQVAVNNPPLEIDRFQNGRLVTNGASYSIFENSTNTISISIQKGTLTTIVGQPFTIYDDDDFNSNDITKLRPLHGDEGEDIPLLNQDFLKDNDTVPVDINTPDTNALVSAYIRPKYDLTGGRDNDAPFLANIPNNTGQAVRNAFHFDNVLLNAREDFWTIYLLSGYQDTIDHDGDPVTETTVALKLTVGASDAQHGQGSIVYFEALSTHECFGTSIECSIATTKVHEVGHLLNADHNQGGVMDNLLVNFSEISLNEIRKNPRP